MKAIDLTGQRFGRRVVLERRGTASNGGAMWLCRCDCGRETVAKSGHLRQGEANSCGCATREAVTTHGMRKTAEYTIWHNMIRRCTDPQNAAYDRYGGRGVKVCDRWLAFENFFADMGSRPSPELTLERPDNDGPYEPGNCVWATPLQQSRNRRKYRNNVSGITGVYQDAKRKVWIAEVGEKYVGRFSTKEEAVTAREAELKLQGFSAKHGR